jgi:molecular chaperone DnaK (HSP70)
VSSEHQPGIGLDFGTSTTLAASPSGIVPIGTASAWMPSVVGQDDSGSTVAGEAALDLPEDQIVRSVKRSITENRPFVRVDTPTGKRDVQADDLIAGLLREAASRAAAHGLVLDAPSALKLGCPAMWDGRQRRRLVDAAARAGLPVTLATLVDEPVAAGLAWLAGRSGADRGPQRVVVFDMGGGTLDVAVMDVRPEGASVLAALGVPEAGDTLDGAIAEDLEYALVAQGVDVDSLPYPRRARKRLQYAAREAKVALTTEVEHDVVLPKQLFGIGWVTYDRERLNTAFAAQMDRAVQCVVTALMAAYLADGTVSEITSTPIEELVDGVDVVLLSGGMSRVPYVAQRLGELFPPGTRIESATARSEEAVAAGLAQAGRFGRVNMYRPAFDVLLEWDSGQEMRTVYEAYTPLVQPQQILQGGEARFIGSGRDLSLPQTGKGRLRILSHSDAEVRATLGGSSVDDFVVALNGPALEFSIFPDGRLRLVDASGTHDGRIEGWAVPEPRDQPVGAGSRRLSLRARWRFRRRHG